MLGFVLLILGLVLFTPGVSSLVSCTWGFSQTVVLFVPGHINSRLDSGGWAGSSVPALPPPLPPFFPPSPSPPGLLDAPLAAVNKSPLNYLHHIHHSRWRSRR